MAKVVKRADQKKRTQLKDNTLPLGKENFYIIGLGVVVIIVGYLALARGPVEGFLPLVFAPVLLVLGYCVIIPLGILFKKSYLKSQNPTQTQS